MTVFKPFQITRINFKITMLIIFVCTVVSLSWSTFPLFGWSHYSLEASLTTCSVEWAERSWNVYSYNICMFLFVFILPLILIAFCNVRLYTTVIHF